MNTLVHKQLFCTTIFSITGKGLRISKQSIFGYSSIIIPYAKLDEEVALGKTFNRDYLDTSYVFFILAAIRLLISKSFTELYFLLLMASMMTFVVLTVFSIRKTVKVPELRIFKYFSGNMDNARLEKFLKTLFERRDDFIHFRIKDMKNGTDLEKQYANLVSLFATNTINEKEFLTRRQIMKLSFSNDPGKSDHFYN